MMTYSEQKCVMIRKNEKDWEGYSISPLEKLLKENKNDFRDCVIVLDG